ncbi:MAG: hypothetical protein K2N69_04655 [Helicobacter sp.]|nr:hypothetical protein [Helicobacter sp.]
MKKGFISLVAAAAISGIALADSNTTELDLISIATQGAMSEQSAGIVALSEAEAAEVVGGVSIVVNGVATGKSPKPIGNIRGYAKGPLAGATVTVKKP